MIVCFGLCCKILLMSLVVVLECDLVVLIKIIVNLCCKYVVSVVLVEVVCVIVKLSFSCLFIFCVLWLFVLSSSKFRWLFFFKWVESILVSICGNIFWCLNGNMVLIL